MVIDVNKTLVYQKYDEDEKKTFHIELPKTKNSVRKVPITEQCKEALLRQRRQKAVVASKTCYKPLESYEQLLFTTKYGTPINAQIYNDAIKSTVEEVNLMRTEIDAMSIFSSHKFRHTFASRCFEAGISPRVVQEYLGHKTLAMTMDLYTHVLDEQKSDELNKLNLEFE